MDRRNLYLGLSLVDTLLVRMVIPLQAQMPTSRFLSLHTLLLLGYCDH